MSLVWVVGVTLLILYSVISYLKVINNVKTSTLVRDDIFETDRIVTPFVCGFMKPKIYIPTDISQSELPYILAHERVHIKRLDYLIKPFAFLVLSVHWFNPLMWLSFFLMSKDLEMSCDESVLKLFGDETRANYSQSLLALATGKRQLLSGSPLAFGESNAKARIINVLSYKKPPFWVVVVALIATFALVVLFTANPKNDLLATGVYSGFKTETLLANKTLYVGDASKVVALIDAMPLPAGVVRDSVELQTSATPYSITIHYTVSELEGRDNTYAFRNPILLFSLVDNVDVIYSSILDITNKPSTSTSTFPYTREYADQLMDGDVRDYASNTSTLITLIDRINSIPFGKRIIAPDINKITAQGPYKDQIEKYLAKIMSSPQISSNPQDYIKAHENEYNAILAMDHKALTYLFSEFKKGDQNGLKGHIMMNLCRTILDGEDIKSAITTPQDWYDTYKDHIQRMVNENGIDWVHQNAPKGSLIRA
ncbi:M56 family metallopeptidase [Desulfosporosinus nitroreducens]|uniref:M56 family metallopeptidase n=1 Tax=Desulfosporosinus nitroreducens TaxID=2018668 RepID=UPI00207C9151|nr:M56 family metallopeptidase [Desulfosporosinus nitroreducens]MCO1602090.1 M56 family metallopeptidase [Desulfosporosinus nitroreducens]